jgi:glycosyltransferase involved in cell wall biosynthesis
VRVVLLPYADRLSRTNGARLLSPLLRRVIGDRTAVFHCRGEVALLWAHELAPRFGGGGIVGDIRGAGPEELLAERGFDGLEEADVQGVRQYHGAMSQLHAALSAAGPVISVSPGMLDWLEGIGVRRDRLTWVPCCVRAIAFTEEARRARRAALGLEGKLVLAYAGTLASYQRIEDGLLPFFDAAARCSPRAHLLCLTNDPVRLRAMVERHGVSSERVTVLRVPQREVAEYLCAADCGVLLRAPGRMTPLTMPVKFAEYLASGLPIVTSRVGGWLDDVVEREDVGIAVDCIGRAPDEIRAEAARACAALEERGAAMRARALALCERDYLWQRHTARVRETYGAALSWVRAGRTS